MSPTNSLRLLQNTNPEARRWSRSGLHIVLCAALSGLTLGPAGLGCHAGVSRAAAAAYVSRLSTGSITMSTSGNLGGGQETYLDGTVKNNGDRTVSGVTVQVTFHDFSNGIAARDTVPVTLIRFRQPYVDVEPVSLAPIRPGESRQFRVAFDSVPDSWNQSYPDVRVVGVQLR